jgi:hypothetical protein
MNPLGHVCVVRNPRGRLKLKPRASASLVTCGKCGKPYSNPLGHVCTNAGDFKRRAAAAGRRGEAVEKREKAAAARAKEVAARQARRAREDEARRSRRAKEAAATRARKVSASAARTPRAAHDYQVCPDEDCTRAVCLAYREGVADGAEMAEEAQA